MRDVRDASGDLKKDDRGNKKDNPEDFSEVVDPSLLASGAAGIAGLTGFMADTDDPAIGAAEPVTAAPKDNVAPGFAEKDEDSFDLDDGDRALQSETTPGADAPPEDASDVSGLSGVGAQSGNRPVDVQPNATTANVMPPNASVSAKQIQPAIVETGSGNAKNVAERIVYDTWEPSGEFMNSVADGLGDENTVFELAAVDQYGTPLEYTLTDAGGSPLTHSQFVIDGNIVRLAPGVELDYEGGSTETFYVTATNTGGVSGPWEVVLTIMDVAEDIALADAGASFVDAGVSELSITGGAGNDTITGHDDGSVIDSGAGADQVIGGDAVDLISGGLGNDTISAGGGADILTGGAGDDSLDGGGGADIAVFSGVWSDYTITEAGGVYTIVDNRDDSPDGTDTLINVQTLRFSDGDVSVAEALNDRPELITSDGTVAENVAGAAIGAVIATDADAGDTLTYDVDDIRFEIVGGQLALKAGESLDYETDGDTVSMTVTVTDAHGASDTQLVTITVGDEAETIQLGDGGTTFVDTGVAEASISGGSGADNITGHDDGAMIQGEQGADRVTGGDGDDTLDGGTGDDTMDGGAGADILSGGASEDILAGGTGSDTLKGNLGDDAIDGGEGTDRAVWDGGLADFSVAYDAETDSFTISDLDVAEGDEGTDTVTGVEVFTFNGVDYTADELRVEAERQTNTGPTVPTLDTGGSIDENGATDAIVATLTASDQDGDDLTFQITDAAGAPIADTRFEIVGNEVRLRAGADLDYETGASLTLYVTASDAFETSAPQEITVTVGDVAEALVLGNGGVSFADTGVAETSVTGGSGNDAITAHIDGGTLAGGSGADTLTGDDGSDRLDGGTGTDRLHSGNDDDTLTGGAGDDTLDGGLGTDVAVFSGNWADYSINEDGGIYTIVDTRSDSPDGTDTVTNVETLRFADGDVTPAAALNDGPDVTATDGTIAENDTGAIVGSVTASDPDVGDAVTLSVDGARFEIVGGALKLKDGMSLDYEDGGTVSVTVTATDLHGATDSQVVTVTVDDVAEGIVLDEGGADFTDTGTAETSITGGTGDDTITAHDDGGTLDGAVGDDTLTGGASDDSLTGGVGDDSLSGGDGDDTFNGGTGNDTIVGGGQTEDVPVVFMNFESTGSSVASDDTPNGHNGIYQGGASPASPGWNGTGTAVALDGVDGYVEIPDHSDFDLSAGTVATRFNADTMSGDQGLVSRDSRNFDGGGHFRLALEDNGSIQLRIQSETTSYYLSSPAGTVSTGEWHHVAISFGPDGLEMFVDGASVASSSYTGGLMGNDEPWTLGADQRQSGDATADNLKHFFDGSIDEFAVYDVQLDSDAIADIAANGVTANFESDTVVYSGDRSDYDVTYDAQTDEFTVRDLNAADGDDGTDIVSGVEVFSFNGVEFAASELSFAAPELSVADGGLSENAAGASVGEVSVNEAVTYTLDDGRFEVVDGDLKLKDGVSLDYEADGETVTVTVTVTNAHGASDTQAVTVAVSDVSEGITLGDGGEQFTDTGTTEARITGGAGDDTVTGTDEDSLIEGGGGDDSLAGELGNDTLSGDAGNDFVSGGGGDDMLTGDTSQNLIVNGSFEDINGAQIDSVRAVMNEVDGWTDANGNAFEMHVDGYGSNEATDGNYWLDMSGQGDRMDISQTVAAIEDGEAYVLSFDAGNYSNGMHGELEVYFGNALIATIDPDVQDQMDTYAFQLIGGSGDGSNTLRFVEVGSSGHVGAALDNIKLVVAGDDTLSGGDGNDTLEGGVGDDVLDGGAGEDRAVFTGALADYDVTYEPGTDTFTITDMSARDGDDGTDTVTGVEAFVFDGITYTFSDLVAVSNSESTSDDRDDTPDTTTAGSDASHATTEGDDVVWATSGEDVIYGLGGNDTIGGLGDDDRLDGGAGNDQLHGNDGNDTILGGSGNDTVYAHTGHDEVYGDAGNDALYGIEGADTIHGGSGNDTIYGGHDSDILYGDADADLMYGEDGTDTLFGGTGNDTVHGGAGNDHLYGLLGDDSLVGDNGDDTFYFSAMQGSDVVLGGSGASWTDVISLQGINGDSVAEDDGTIEGDGWTMALEAGHSVTSITLDSVELSLDAAGTITFDDGGQIDFAAVERIEF